MRGSEPRPSASGNGFTLGRLLEDFAHVDHGNLVVSAKARTHAGSHQCKAQTSYFQRFIHTYSLGPSVEGYLIYLIVRSDHEIVLFPGEARKRATILAPAMAGASSLEGTADVEGEDFGVVPFVFLIGLASTNTSGPMGRATAATGW